jgi:large subunit ribosomal protein L25
MEKVVLHATHREVKGKQVGRLRREGKLPAVIYGHGLKPTSLTLDLKEATKTMESLTGSSIVTLELDGKENAALVREKQRDYIRGTLLHVDFQAVSLTEKLRTEVEIEVTGFAPAVKDFNGVLVTNLEEVEVECLPQDLPERIKVDVSGLLKIGDAIYVRDLPAIENVTILSKPEELIVNITATKEEPVVEEVPVEAEVEEEPEVIEKGKKEEEVPEEGTPPAGKEKGKEKE